MTSSTPRPDLRVGYIGLGAIGLPIAERIADAGWPMRVWNRTATKMAPMQAKGATAAYSARDLAGQVDVLFLCLTDDKAVEQVVFGEAGIAQAANAKLTVVDLSTIHPMTTKALASRLTLAGGGRWVDLPVSGGPSGARAGTLATFAGGRADDVERIRPVAMSFAGQLTHMGEQGSGQATKACNQMISFATASVLAEVLNMAARFGLEVERLPQALAGGFADSAVLRHYGPRMIAGEYSGSTTTALKDIDIAVDLGRQTGAPLPITSLLSSFYRLVVARGYTDDGLSGVMRMYSEQPLRPRS